MLRSDRAVEIITHQSLIESERLLRSLDVGGVAGGSKVSVSCLLWALRLSLLIAAD